METETTHLIIGNHQHPHLSMGFMADVIDYCRDKAYMPGSVGADLASLFADTPVTDTECVQYFIDALNDTVDRGYYSLNRHNHFVVTHPTEEEN